MTKAQAMVHASDKWEYQETRIEDHNSLANTTATIFHSKDGWYRLVCYGNHGDSILWKSEPDGRGNHNWHNLGNIEHNYDTVLKELV